MNKLFFAGAKTSNLAAWAIVLLTLAQLCWLQSRPDAALKSIPARLKNPAAALAPYQDYDDFAARSGAGNVFIKLVGCPRINPDAEAAHSFSDYHEFFLSAWYFRTAYNLYPRRALVAPPDTIINGGWNLMGIAFVPDQAWLARHAVHSVLTLGFDAAGRPLAPRWEPLSGAKTKIGGD
ncbi:MAG: hypothetical protein P4N60_03630 [Verrucomicrobiae bacterium]|nr:hypothetical protein [Verrucomicrobiae bacterium]